MGPLKHLLQQNGQIVHYKIFVLSLIPVSKFVLFHLFDFIKRITDDSMERVISKNAK